MALYMPHSIFHLYVRPETFGPYYVHASLPIRTKGRILGTLKKGLKLFFRNRITLDRKVVFISCSKTSYSTSKHRINNAKQTPRVLCT